MTGENECQRIFENVLFTKVFRTFRVAIQPTKLAIALAAVAIICLAGWIMDQTGPVVATEGGFSELDAYLSKQVSVADFIKANKETGQRVGLFYTLWHHCSQKFHAALYSLFSFRLPDAAAHIGGWFQAAGWAIKYHYIYCAIFIVIKLAVISIAGGAICRIAALQFARDEKPGLTEALRYGFTKILSFFTAPLLPAAMIVFIGVFVLLLGLLANITWVGELLMGVFMPLALLAGALIAVIVIGAVAGFNLMFPAVAYDGSDCFDAMSRAMSYIYSRPWSMALYSGLAVVYGAICYVFVRFFAFLMLLTTYVILDIGLFRDGKMARLWPRPTFAQLVPPGTEATANGTEWFSAHLIYLFLLVVVGLMVAFVISFYFSANTIIYALMRKKVDDTTIDDIYVPTDAEQAEAGEAAGAAEQAAEQEQAGAAEEPGEDQGSDTGKQRDTKQPQGSGDQLQEQADDSENAGPQA